MGDLIAERDTIAAIQERSLSCPGFGGLHSEILSPVAEFLNAETSCFLQVRSDVSGQTGFGRTAAYNVTELAHRDYVEHHFRSDPAIGAAARNCGRKPYVFCTADVSDYAQLTKSEFYNEFFRPNHIHHVMAVALRPQLRHGDMLMLGFHRPRGNGPFKPFEKERLKSVAAALGSSMRILCLQDDLHHRELAVGEFDQRLPQHGLSFFDEHMALLYANKAGLDHLRFTESGGKARLDQLGIACKRAAKSGGGDGGKAAECLTSGDLQIQVKVQYDHDGRLLFMVHSNSGSNEGLFTQRCQQYEFSPRECDIARAIAAGLSNAEVAGRLYISIRTVENHLRSIYSKASVIRRTQLLSRLSDYA